MKKTLLLFLKTSLLVVVLMSILIMIRFPQIEGRAVNLSLIDIYTDPFILYLYLASLPFYVSLVQVFRLLNNAENNTFYSSSSLNSVRNIKYCSLLTICFMLLAEVYIFVVERSRSDDIAGGVVTGFVLIILAIIATVVLSIFQKYLRHRVS